MVAILCRDPAAKKDYLKDLQQYRVQNEEPEIEGGMVRTGSDSCLSNNVENATGVSIGVGRRRKGWGGGERDGEEGKGCGGRGMGTWYDQVGVAHG